MIELTLVTGFLGSGKTTFLRQVMHRERNRQLAFVVNEFADEDVDGKALAEENRRVLTVLGGSIFCECRAADFVEILFLLPARVPDLEGVVVEASGMANPKSVGTLLHKSGLDKMYRLARVVSLVDPGNVGILIETLPVLRDQLESSDLILVNKCDCYSEEEIAAAEMVVRDLAPDIPQRRTRFAAIDTQLPDGSGSGLDAPLVACAPPQFHTIMLYSPCTIRAQELLDHLARYSEQLYRVKGVLSCPDASVRVEFDGRRWRSRPVDDGDDGVLVVIADRAIGHSLEEVSRFFDGAPSPPRILGNA